MFTVFLILCPHLVKLLKRLIIAFPSHISFMSSYYKIKTGDQTKTLVCNYFAPLAPVTLSSTTFPWLNHTLYLHFVIILHDLWISTPSISFCHLLFFQPTFFSNPLMKFTRSSRPPIHWSCNFYLIIIIPCNFIQLVFHEPDRKSVV